jgi:hypothetical protein
MDPNCQATGIAKPENRDPHCIRKAWHLVSFLGIKKIAASITPIKMARVGTSGKILRAATIASARHHATGPDFTEPRNHLRHACKTAVF